MDNDATGERWVMTNDEPPITALGRGTKEVLYMSIFKELFADELKKVIREEVKAALDLARMVDPSSPGFFACPDDIPSPLPSLRRPEEPQDEIVDSQNLAEQQAVHIRSAIIKESQTSCVTDIHNDPAGGDGSESVTRYIPSAMDTFLQRVDDAWNTLGSVEMPKQGTFLEKVIESSLWKTLVNAAIFANVVFMIVNLDHSMSTDNADSNTSPFFSIEVGFLVFYTIEFLVKIVHFRSYYFYDVAWKFNFLDLFLLISSLWGVVSTVILSNSEKGPGLTWLRSLRLLRIAKTLRILKLAAYFRTLRAMILCCTSSFMTLFWSILMLVVSCMMGALVMVSRISTFLEGEEPSEDLREQLQGWFGSVGLATEHMLFASTGSTSWSDYYEVLAEVGFIDKFIYLLLILFIQLALLNIILGIFVDSAMSALEPAPDAKAQEYYQGQVEIKEAIQVILDRADRRRTGRLTEAEFNQDALVPLCKYMDMLGFPQHNVKEFFRTLNEEDQSKKGVDIQEFLHGCMRFKGTPSRWDFTSLYAEIDEVKKMQVDVLTKLYAMLRKPTQASAQKPHGRW